MNRSSIISATLNTLELQAANVYSDLLKGRKEFNFLLEAERECTGSDEEILQELIATGTLDQLPLIEFRNDLTGNIFDCYILKVDEDGVHIVEMVCDNIKSTYGFSKLGGLEDRLILLNEMEELPK